MAAYLGVKRPAARRAGRHPQRQRRMRMHICLNVRMHVCCGVRLRGHLPHLVHGCLVILGLLLRLQIWRRRLCVRVRVSRSTCGRWCVGVQTVRASLSQACTLTGLARCRLRACDGVSDHCLRLGDGRRGHLASDTADTTCCSRARPQRLLTPRRARTPSAGNEAMDATKGTRGAREGRTARQRGQKSKVNGHQSRRVEA